MSKTQGLLIAFTRCNDAGRLPQWSHWYDDVHLPALLAGEGAWVATRWELSEKPVPGRPSIGFSHLTVYEFEGPDLDAQVEALLVRDRALREAGEVHPNHCLIGAEVYRAHGKWRDKPEPSLALRGHILAWVMSNDPAQEAAWDAWYDAEHAPDMLASEAFSALTRWQRQPRTRFGAQHLTLYDVELESIAEAVERSFAVMPGLHESGRLHPCHTGAMAITLVPSGRHGAGLRA